MVNWLDLDSDRGKIILKVIKEKELGIYFVFFI